MKINQITLLTFLVFIGLTFLLRYLDQTPPSIIPFEFAKTAINAQNIVQQWDSHNALELKKWTIYIDYGYLLVYSLLLFLILQKLAIPYRIVLTFPFIAAALDFIENTCLLPFLYFKGNDTLAQIAFYAASIKFGLIGISILFILYAWVARKCTS